MSRLSRTLFHLRAALAIAITGVDPSIAPVAAEQQATVPESQPAESPTVPVSKDQQLVAESECLRRALAHVGLFSRVAAAESLSVGHVVQVAKGRRTSARVIQAIVREVRRIELKGGVA